MKPENVYKLSYIGFLNWLTYFKDLDEVNKKQI